MENIKYEWVISQMDCSPSKENLTDVVVTIHWRRNATVTVDGKEYFSDSFGAYYCPLPSGDGFTPYNELTKEQVEGWLNYGLDVSDIDGCLHRQLENKINPPVISLPLPWSQSELI